MQGDTAEEEETQGEATKAARDLGGVSSGLVGGWGERRGAFGSGGLTDGRTN